jgi:hypothetical protein
VLLSTILRERGYEVRAFIEETVRARSSPGGQFFAV